MALTRDQLKTKIKQHMDEVSSFENAQTDAVDQVGNFMDEAARQILLTAPLHTISPTDFSDETTHDNGDNTGYIELPNDMIRLHTFKMNKWKRAITGDEVISDTHPLYTLQKSSVTRGGVWKPVAVLTHKDVGSLAADYELVLEYFSVTGDDHTVDIALYVKDEAAEELSKYQNSRIIDAVIWQTVANLLSAYGDPQGAERAMAYVNKWITDNAR